MSHYCVGVIVEDIDNFKTEIEKLCLHGIIVKDMSVFVYYVNI